MSDHFSVRHTVARNLKMKFKFFAHFDEGKAREPNNIQRLRKCANKNTTTAPLKKDTKPNL